LFKAPKTDSWTSSSPIEITEYDANQKPPRPPPKSAKPLASSSDLLVNTERTPTDTLFSSSATNVRSVPPRPARSFATFSPKSGISAARLYNSQQSTNDPNPTLVEIDNSSSSSSSSYSSSYGSTSSDITPPISPRVFNETTPPVSPRIFIPSNDAPPPKPPRDFPTHNEAPPPISPRVFPSNSDITPPASPRVFPFGLNLSSGSVPSSDHIESRSESSHSISSTSSTYSNSSSGSYEHGTLSRGNSISANKRKTKILYAPRVVKPYKTTSTQISDTNKENVNLMYSERETDTLKELFTLLVTNQPEIFKEFFKFQIINVDELCETLISMSFATSTPMQLIKYFIEDDFKTFRSDSNNILMENSIASKLIKIYLSKVGVNYLVDLLGDVLNQIVVNDRKVSYEINPTFLEPDELEKNKKTLQKRINSIFDCIFSKESVDKMPTGIRVIAGTIAECARQYASNTNYPLIGGFIMLR
jgi:hypothetical protein